MLSFFLVEWIALKKLKYLDQQDIVDILTKSQKEREIIEITVQNDTE